MRGRRVCSHMFYTIIPLILSEFYIVRVNGINCNLPSTSKNHQAGLMPFGVGVLINHFLDIKQGFREATEPVLTK